MKRLTLMLGAVMFALLGFAEASAQDVVFRYEHRSKHSRWGVQVPLVNPFSSYRGGYGSPYGAYYPPPNPSYGVSPAGYYGGGRRGWGTYGSG